MKKFLLIILIAPLMIAQNNTVWVKVDSVSANNPYSAHCNPMDEAVYFVQRNSNQDGVYKYSADSGLVFICSADRPAAVTIDPRDGDIFHSEDYGGAIFYTPFNSTGRITWVSGFHSDDDDPVGMAIVPENFKGRGFIPGQVILADRGYNGLDEIWMFSADTTQNEWPLHTDNGTLINPIDIAITDSNVYVVDEGEGKPGRIFEVDSIGVLTQLILNDTLTSPIGLTYDPVSRNLYLLDSQGRVLEVNPINGNVTEIMTGFQSSAWNWCGIDISPAGDYLIITENVADYIHIFHRTIQAVEGNNQPVISEFELNQNYPNPFNPTTVISFQLPVGGDVMLKVFDVLGKEVALLVNEEQPAGKYEVEFDGSRLASGIYFYKLSATGGAGKFTAVKKLMLIK